MNDDFETVKKQVNICAFFTRQGFTLTKIGQKNFRINPAPCCNHNDCFTIYENKQSFKCFSCKIYGDIFNYYEKKNNITKSEALKSIADMYGIALNENYNQIKNNNQDIFHAAIKYYHNCLLNSTDKIKIENKIYTPLEYQIEIRKHSIDILKQFKIGWADGKLLKHLIDKRYRHSELKLLAGSFFTNPQNQLKDRYYKCFTYPYFINGTIGNLNSKNLEKKSLKFSKEFIDNRCLFYDQDSLENNNEIIACEGENDAHSIIDKGGWTGGVIATGGNISERQINFIQELHNKNKKIYLAFDQDNAGAGYVEKLKELKNIKVIQWKFSHKGIKDIDEVLCNSKNPKETFQKLIESAFDIESFLENPETIKKILDNIRDASSKELKPTEKERKISSLIIHYLLTRGKFLKILSNQSFYFFDNKTKRLLNIRKLQFEIFINEYFGVNSAKNEYK